MPESQRGSNADLATMGTMIGSAVMMVLDVGGSADSPLVKGWAWIPNDSSRPFCSFTSSPLLLSRKKAHESIKG